MPLAPETEILVNDLLDLYRNAQTNIDELIRTSSDLTIRGRAYRARLAELSRAITNTLADLDAIARGWSTRSLTDIYAASGTRAAADIGRPFNWTQIHREAVQQLATETFDDLLAATRFVRRDIKAFIRIAAREHAAAVLLEGKTATQAGRELARRLERRGISAVTYKNGARHSLRDYADTVVRTRAASAQNGGTLNVAREHGVEWAQCFDGSGCGFTSHDDPDKANGSVRSIAEFEAHPVAHPRCARSWGLLPVKTRAEADRLAAGDYSDFVADAPPVAGGGAHQRRLQQREARLTARAERVGR